MSVIEECDDGESLAQGEKLLHLLQKWDIENVVLVVTGWNNDLKGEGGKSSLRRAAL